jgi:hypothetical protein
MSEQPDAGPVRIIGDGLLPYQGSSLVRAQE